MKYPANIVLQVKSKAEHDELVKGLQAGVTKIQENGGDAAVYARLLSNIKYLSATGVAVNFPEAYVEVSGKRHGPGGTMKAMRDLFNAEIASHSGTVVLFQRHGLEYKPIMTRRAGR